MAYTGGNAGYVRRLGKIPSSQALPTPAAGWTARFDASTLSTLWQDSARTTQVVSAGDPVKAWDSADGTAGVVSFISAAGTVFSTYQPSVVNSYGVVRSIPTRDAIMQEQVGLVDSGMLSANTNTVFVVVYYNTVNAGSALGTSADYMAWQRNDPLLFHYSATATFPSLAGDHSGQWGIVTFWGDASTTGIGWNDTRTASLGTTANSFVFAAGRKGELLGSVGGVMLNGDMAECMFYSTALSETDRKLTEKYLAAKYGITLPY